MQTWSAAPGPPAPPTDSGDEAYEKHDQCFDCCNGNNSCMKSCNKELVKDLKKLPSDSKKWPRPPRSGTESDSEWYRQLAIWYF